MASLLTVLVKETGAAYSSGNQGLVIITIFTEESHFFLCARVIVLFTSRDTGLFNHWNGSVIFIHVTTACGKPVGAGIKGKCYTVLLSLQPLPLSISPIHLCNCLLDTHPYWLMPPPPPHPIPFILCICYKLSFTWKTAVGPNWFTLSIASCFNPTP